MQGYKSYEEKLFYTFCLSERVPGQQFLSPFKGCSGPILYSQIYSGVLWERGTDQH